MWNFLGGSQNMSKLHTFFSASYSGGASTQELKIALFLKPSLILTLTVTIDLFSPELLN